MNKADVLKILAENGLNDQGGSPHGWRCDHPDRYPGYCQCASVIAEDIVNDLAAHDAEVERRAAERALREAVADMRRAREGSWNLRDPRNPEVAYSVDVWLEVRANRLADGQCGDRRQHEPH